MIKKVQDCEATGRRKEQLRTHTGGHCNLCKLREPTMAITQSPPDHELMTNMKVMWGYLLRSLTGVLRRLV